MKTERSYYYFFFFLAVFFTAFFLAVFFLAAFFLGAAFLAVFLAAFFLATARPPLKRFGASSVSQASRLPFSQRVQPHEQQQTTCPILGCLVALASFLPGES